MQVHQELRMKPTILSLVLVLGAAGSAYAIDPVYKSTMPDGRVIYGEVPTPGAKRVDKIAAPPESAGVTVATQEDKARAEMAFPTTPAPTRAPVGVIPQRPRESPTPPVAGQRGNPQDYLPSRSSY
jgi:hypothetical protein